MALYAACCANGYVKRVKREGYNDFNNALLITMGDYLLNNVLI